MGMEKVLVIFATLLASCNAQPTIAVDASENQVLEGTDVTIRCRINGFKPGQLIYWLKDQGDGEVQIATNTILTAVFENSGRYSADSQQSGDEVIFILNIIGAQVEDSGDIGCSIPQEDHVLGFTSLSVVVPVSTIALYGVQSNASDATPEREFKDGEVVEFHEGDQYFFHCVTAGSNPAPDMSMTIGPNDITDMFIREEQEMMEEGGNPGLERKTFDAQLKTSKAVTVSYEQNTHRFACHANLPGVEPVSVGIEVMLKFPPRVECQPLALPHYAKKVELTCHIRADPPVVSSEINWTWDTNDGKANTTLASGQTDGHYTATVMEGATPDEMVATLHISLAYPQVFRVYQIHVENEQGKLTTEVELQRDPAKEVISGTSSLTAATLLTLTMIATAIANHHSL